MRLPDNGHPLQAAAIKPPRAKAQQPPRPCATETVGSPRALDPCALPVPRHRVPHPTPTQDCATSFCLVCSVGPVIPKRLVKKWDLKVRVSEFQGEKAFPPQQWCG